MSRRQTFITSAIAMVVLYLVAATAMPAQQTSSSSAAVTTVPRLVRVTSAFVPANGLPPAPVETVTLAIYAEATGGAPLWQETQTVVVDVDGRYTLLLGATLPEGLPLELFASGEARWLGRRFERPDEGEQARALLVSVPYALKASDADTLGGRPPSAYLLAEPGMSEGASATRPSAGATSAGAASKSASPSALPLSVGAVNYVGKFINTTELGNSAIYDAGGFVGVNTTTPLDILHARFTNTNGGLTGLAVQNLGNTATSYSGMLFYDQNGALGQFQGFNNSTHEYRINNIASNGSINFMLGHVSRFQVRADGDVDIPGNLRKGGVPFLHNAGTENTFLGEYAGNFTMTGASNTASGAYALSSNTTGWGNTASGDYALTSNTEGHQNTASGFFALTSNTTGYQNTASGHEALGSNTTGLFNAASGSWALFSNNTGRFNTATGSEALYSNTTGWFNTATGTSALGNNITGSANTASGYAALDVNATGTNNTASGAWALLNNTMGDLNVAIGMQAGLNATTGSNNIYLGANVTGSAGESNTMYLGLQGTQTKTVVAGIRGITTGLGDAIPVVIDPAGQLGTVSSSRRFKEDIREMGDASRAIFALRPVTFRYTQAYADGAKPLQYGLVAEEVADVFPALAVFNADGGVDTVHYETLSVLLLNEFQQQQERIEGLLNDVQQQRQRLETQRGSIDTQRIEIDLLKARLAALEAPRP